MTLHVLRALRTYPRESVGAFLVIAALLIAAVALLIGSSSPFSGPARASIPPIRTAVAPPAPEPLQFRQVTPDDARTINATMPFSGLPNPAASALKAKFPDTMHEARALDCLTAAVYYEAAIEEADGQRAVAQVVLNRVRHPAYPKTVCGVVFQGQERSTGCQFTFTCDGALARAPNLALWTRARSIAWAALSGQVFAPVGWATHYHTDWVVPYWASSLAKATKVGTHIFYRWTGGWGRPPAFTGRYAGIEPSVGKLAALSGAHSEGAVDVALAAGDALDGLAADDEIVITAAGPDRATMRLDVAGGNPDALAAADAGTAAVQQVKTDAKVPWELRWALTGAGPSAPEPALGTAVAASPAKDKDCAAGSKETSVPGLGDVPAITVREKCGA